MLTLVMTNLQQENNNDDNHNICIPTVNLTCV